MAEVLKGMGKSWLFIGGLALLTVATACQSGTETNEDDRLLAQVGTKSLYLSEMEGMFPGELSSSDSLTIIQTYAGRWIREDAAGPG